MSGSADRSTARRFHLVRAEDVSGTSGVGTVAEGVEWSNGWVSLHWLSQLHSKTPKTLRSCLKYMGMKVRRNLSGWTTDRCIRSFYIFEMVV